MFLENMELKFRIKEISGLDDIQFREAYHIYEKAFTPELRMGLRGFARIIKAKNQGQCQHIIVAIFNGTVIGMATFGYFQKYNVGFIGYIVISPKWENRGFGTKLYQGIVEQLSEDARKNKQPTLTALIYEVEKSELAKTNAEQETDLRRIRFFKNAGGQIINATYFQPSIGIGLHPVELNLMINVTDPGFIVTKEGLITMAKSIYENVYGMKPYLPCQNQKKYLKRFELSLPDSQLLKY
jgi:GNAT superfamily N-acetyltransferase